VQHVPPTATAIVSVVGGVLLPQSASKPMANARALRLADACLSMVGGALQEGPGEWPSDFAVIVARWQLGPGAPDTEEAAAGRGAGAAVAVGTAMVLGAAAVRWAVGRRATDVGASAMTSLPSTVAASSVPATAAVVAAAYLVPNELESAAVAALAGAPSAGIAGGLGGAVLLAASVPAFAAPVVTPPDEGNVAAQIATFLHPVLTDGLRNEGASRLLRTHALLDFVAACVIAAAGGAAQAGAHPAGSCVLLAVAMALAATGLTAYYALVRPFAARLEVAVSTVQAGVLMGLCWLTVAAAASDGTVVTANTLATAGLVAEAATFAAPVVLLGAAFRAHLRSTKASEGIGVAAGGVSNVPPVTKMTTQDASAQHVPSLARPLLSLPRAVGRSEREDEETPGGPGVLMKPEAAGATGTAVRNPLWNCQLNKNI
jgi:hypothetical protein